MKKSFTCDLAADMADMCGNKYCALTDTEDLDFGIKKDVVKVVREEKRFGGIPRGDYVTITRSRGERGIDERKYLIDEISQAVSAITDKYLSGKSASFLVTGLGNAYLTSDSLGKKVTEKIITTRNKSGIENMASVAAFPTGVSGITGIESYEVVSGLVSTVKPDVLICVDSLAAISAERIGRSYQITDVGIRAGSGCGKPSLRRIDAGSVGVPVIAIGVPLVISASRLGHLKTAAEDEMFVTPQDVDFLLTDCSEIIAAAINRALLPQMTVEEILSYI